LSAGFAGVSAESWRVVSEFHQVRRLLAVLLAVKNTKDFVVAEILPLIIAVTDTHFAPVRRESCSSNRSIWIEQSQSGKLTPTQLNFPLRPAGCIQFQRSCEIFPNNT